MVISTQAWPRERILVGAQLHLDNKKHADREGMEQITTSSCSGIMRGLRERCADQCMTSVGGECVLRRKNPQIHPCSVRLTS